MEDALTESMRLRLQQLDAVIGRMSDEKMPVNIGTPTPHMHGFSVSKSLVWLALTCTCTCALYLYLGYKVPSSRIQRRQCRFPDIIIDLYMHFHYFSQWRFTFPQDLLIWRRFMWVMMPIFLASDFILHVCVARIE